MSPNRVLAGAVTLLVVASTLPAQDISWGPGVGLNMTKYGGSDATGSENKLGFGGGVYASKGTAGKKLFWVSGVGFQQRGEKRTSGTTEVTTKFNYIEIPVLAGWNFPMKDSKLTPAIVGGTALGIKAGCTFEAGSTSGDCTDVASMDLPLLLGGSVAVAGNGGTSWIFGVMYDLGFMSIDNPPSGTAAKVYNRGFTFFGAYMMPLKKKAK